MKPRTILLLVVAIGCGLVAAFMVNQITARPAAQNTEMVFMAAQNIGVGTQLTAENMNKLVKQSQLPQGTVPVDAIREEKDLKDKLVGRPVTANSILSMRDISSADSAAKDIPPGYRAITVKATLENAHHGFLLPGSKIDLMCITQAVNSQINVSRIFLQNVQVLACNAQTTMPEAGSTVPIPVTLTLAVKPAEAERIYWVTSRGVVGVLLRKPGDPDKAETKGATGPNDEDTAPGGDPKTNQTVQVPVALRKIDPNEVIDNPADLFKMVPYQKGQLPDDIITNLEELKGKRVHQYIGERGFVTLSHLRPFGSPPLARKGILSMRISQGGRADEVHDFHVNADGSIQERREPFPAPGAVSPAVPPASKPASPSESKE